MIIACRHTLAACDDKKRLFDLKLERLNIIVCVILLICFLKVKVECGVTPPGYLNPFMSSSASPSRKVKVLLSFWKNARRPILFSAFKIKPDYFEPFMNACGQPLQ